MRDRTKRQYETHSFKREKLVGLAWLVVFAVMIGGSAYQGARSLALTTSVLLASR